MNATCTCPQNCLAAFGCGLCRQSVTVVCCLLPVLQVFGGSAGGASGPEAIVLWQLIGAGVSMIVAPMAYSCKVRDPQHALLTPCAWRTMPVHGMRSCRRPTCRLSDQALHTMRTVQKS